MLIAQISDLHIKAGRRLAYNRVDTAAAAEATIAHINAMTDQVDAVLVTGDVVDAGSAAEYVEARKILDTLNMPYYVIPGNHDHAATMMEAFADHAYIDAGLDHLSYTIDEFPLRLVGLDTSVAGKPFGTLPVERLRWLEEILEIEAGRPTLIFLHHPPFRMGIVHMDVQNLLNADQLFSVLKGHPQVRHVAAGHIHRAAETVINGIGCSTAPAPAHAVTLDLAIDGKPSYTLEPPLLRLFRFADNNVVTHLSPIGTFDGPHPFFNSDGSLID